MDPKRVLYPSTFIVHGSVTGALVGLKVPNAKSIFVVQNPLKDIALIGGGSLLTQKRIDHMKD